MSFYESIGLHLLGGLGVGAGRGEECEALRVGRARGKTLGAG